MRFSSTISKTNSQSCVLSQSSCPQKNPVKPLVPNPSRPTGFSAFEFDLPSMQLFHKASVGMNEGSGL